MMDKKKGKPVYEPPVFRDLSGISASGQISPMGICSGGGSLTSEFCDGGDAPEGGACEPTGVSPEYGYCDSGQSAVEGCSSGGIHR